MKALVDHAPAAADLRSLLLAQASLLMGPRPAEQRQRFGARATELLSAASHEELEQIARRVLQEDTGWGYRPPFALARALHLAMADETLTADSQLEGAEHLAPLREQPLLLLPNHISFADANLVSILLERAGFTDICERLTVVAGPKVYSDPLRRFSSLCFGTVKIAQSASRASEEAMMRPRDVARIAQQAIVTAFERLDAGDALLVFGEGTRSRDGALQPMLPAIARYCERPDLWLVPVGIAGTERLMGISDREVHRTRVLIRLGPPLLASELRARCDHKRPRVVEAIGRAIAETLPEPYRGVYAG